MPEEAAERPAARTSQISRRDVAVILAVLLALALLSQPVCEHFRRQSEIAENKMNLRAVWNAMTGYAQDNNDRLPQAYYDVDGAVTTEAGLPVAWPTLVGSGMSARARFVSRATRPGEAAQVLDGDDVSKPLEVSYGMYRGLSAVPVGHVPDPSLSVMVADSANAGANGSYSPVRLALAEGGDSPNDGFVLGWDDSDTVFSGETKAVTRLAFFGVGEAGLAGAGVTGRFGKTVYGVSVSGGLVELGPTDAAVEYVYPLLQGMWWANPRVYR